MERMRARGGGGGVARRGKGRLWVAHHAHFAEILALKLRPLCKGYLALALLATKAGCVPTLAI
jgi:hypothetical protein